ncbi:hypothetical protein BCD60_10430 [Neisseria meningitidis]|nr:hypothetical protein [Neisseria meningitidis]
MPIGNGQIVGFERFWFDNDVADGLGFEDFKQLFHHPKSYGVDKYYLSNESYPTYVYEFDEIGVQAWEAKGKIVTIIAGGKDNYSTEPYYDE